MSSITRTLAILGLGSVALAAVACEANVSLGRDTGDAGTTSTPSFTPDPSDGGDAEAESPLAPTLLACIGTTCPEPYATCLDVPSFKCGTNLMNDPKNCGACGVSCEGFEPINMSASCVQGACAFECQIKQDGLGAVRVFKNCNGLLDDGCEIDSSSDPENCGVCGNKCKEGEHCINGKCGCSGGKVDCGGRCVDVRFEDSNCGACGAVCTKPNPACSPMPANTRYGCVSSACGALKCNSGYADCNDDLNEGCASDGCETKLATDPKNCGACGVVCGPEQECRDDGNGPQCLDLCEKSGLTKCTSGCRDLLADRFNCGGCGISCPNPRANQSTECHKGVCELECLPGFADCNGDPNDGCEVDLRVHPANCGACGMTCDFGAGQPCIDGKCLMVECDAGVTK